MELKLIRMEVVQPSNMNNQTVALRTKITYGIEQSNLDNFYKEIEKVKATDTLGDDKVFFTPWSEVPRYKFNEYARDKPKMSRVINLAKATALVLDPTRIANSIGGNTYVYGYYKIPKTIFQYHTSALGGRKYDELPDDLYIRDNYLSDVQTIVPFSSALAVHVAINEYWAYTDVSGIEERVDLANEVLNGTKKLISDTTILGEINQGVDITPDIFGQLCSMFESGDAETIGLGMDLLANADYKKSEFKIALLLNRFRNQVSSHRSVNLVNFRSLLTYFNKYQWQQTDISFANSVIENSKPEMADYQERLDLVTKCVLDYVNSIVGQKFTVKEVFLKK